MRKYYLVENSSKLASDQQASSSLCCHPSYFLVQVRSSICTVKVDTSEVSDLDCNGVLSMQAFICFYF